MMPQSTTYLADIGYEYTDNDYNPDAEDPVDRWLQTKYSTNSLTTACVIWDIFGAVPDVIVDPFCGAGSAGLAARRLGASFYGVELDPILAAVTLAKTTLSAADIARAEALLPEWITVDWLLKNPIPSRVLALALIGVSGVRPQGRHREDLLAMLRSDLGREHLPAISSTVRCGDSRRDGTWAEAPRGEGTVIFTSPPFGPVAAKPWDKSAGDPKMRSLRRLVAKRVFGAGDRYSPELVRTSKRWATAAILRSALAACQRACGDFTAIIEFQDQCQWQSQVERSSLAGTVGALDRMPGVEVRGIIDTGNFTGTTLYHIVAKARAAQATVDA
ncbi:MAG TPA: hypothetical protein VLX31_14035 [Streptosporangiaceae bacterium]|nr:hypothetical protein [Streptosporangiaceae bacterium]